uniref:uncharacterized protein n=1 Tax=Semicossyphus pulcher TaxID=241346 RepID=UPI0037E80CEA
MEFLGRQEIYIPADAEVKNIPLRSLPRSVLRRMGLSLPDSDSSRRLTDSPEGIWICPAVLRPLGQRIASNRGNSVLENMSSSLAREFRASPGPFQMSFVSSNRAAHRVLKDTLHGANVSVDTSSTPLLPRGSAPHTYQVAVVIYQGRVFLSIRRPSRSQRQGETHEPQPAAQAPIPSTSNGSSEAMSARTRHPAPKKPQKKRLRIMVPSKSLKLQKDRVRQTNSHSSTDQGVTHNRGEVSSSQTAAPVPQSTVRAHRVNNHRHHDAGGEQAAENGAAWLQEEVSNSVRETQELGGEVQSTSHNNNMVSNIQTDSGYGDNTSIQSWIGSEPQSASASLQQEIDYQELDREEKLAQMMAKLEQREAVVKNLNSS